MEAKGRHDPCVLPRAPPIVDAMASITVLDFYLLLKSNSHYTSSNFFIWLLF